MSKILEGQVNAERRGVLLEQGARLKERVSR
jgi:hypothetical protein